MPNRSRLIGRPITLLFRTKHIDRAGQTSSTRIVQAEIIGIHTDGSTRIISDDGVHIQLPSDQIVGSQDSGYIAGQEITRDLHNSTEPFSIRVLDIKELLIGLADAKKES